LDISVADSWYFTYRLWLKVW